MRTLGIDTTTDSGGVILGTDDAILGSVSFENPRGYSDRIIPAVQDLLRQNGWSLGQIDCIGVASGPGGFTGVRVGLSVAKAIGQSLDIPCLTVSTLEALAYRFRGTGPVVAPMMDAGRGQIYGAVYRCVEGESVCLQAERVQTPSEWLDSLPLEMTPLCVGTGARVYHEVVAQHPLDATILPSDNDVLRSLFRLTRMRSDQAGSAHALKANYVRPSDAQRPSVPAANRGDTDSA